MSSPDIEVQRLLQAARLYLAQGELAEAISRATQAIRLDPKEPSAYLVRAEAHRRQKRPDRSLADLAVAIRLDPQNPSPYVIRAEILKRRNIFDQAIADATFAMILDPRNAAAFSIRAECRSAIGDSDGAGEDVQDMLLIDPTRPVPTLGAIRANPNSEVELGNERFWKQAGKADLKQQLESFVDGKTVDKTYRSRPVVSNEDAPEALGVASRYKPERNVQPIPRLRGHGNRSLGNGGRAIMMLGVLIVAGCSLWLVLWLDSGPVTNEKPNDPPPSQVARSNTHEAPSVPTSPELVERPKPIENASKGNEPADSEAVRVSSVIDLIPWINPRRDSVGGVWAVLEGGFVSPEGGSVLKIPYNPPVEYRLTVRLLKGSEHLVGIGLPTPPNQVLIALDSYYPNIACYCKFDVVDNKGIVFHSGSRVLTMFETNTVVFTVRKRSVSVKVNGREIGRWEGDFHRLTVHPEWRYGGKGLFICSVGKGTVLRSIKLESLLNDIETYTSETKYVVPPINEKVTGSLGTNPILMDLGSFKLLKGGRTWNVVMPQQFTKAEIAFYRGDLSEQTLNPAWKGHFQINGRNVVKFLNGRPPTTFVFHDFTTGTDYEEKNEYKKTEPRRYLDVTGFLRPGMNLFYYYHEQRPDLPMGVVLRLYHD